MYLSDSNSEKCDIDFDDTNENSFNKTLCCNNLASTSNKIENVVSKSIEQLFSKSSKKLKPFNRYKSLTPTKRYHNNLKKCVSSPKFSFLEYNNLHHRSLKRRDLVISKRNSSIGAVDCSTKNIQLQSTPRRSISFSSKNSSLNAKNKLVKFILFFLVK